MIIALNNIGELLVIVGVPPAGSPFVNGFAYQASTGRLYTTATKSATDTFKGGVRVSALGQLVTEAGNPPDRPYFFNGGIPSSKLNSATICQFDNVPAPSDPYVGGVRVGPLGGVYLRT